MCQPLQVWKCWASSTFSFEFALHSFSQFGWAFHLRSSPQGGITLLWGMVWVRWAVTDTHTLCQPSLLSFMISWWWWWWWRWWRWWRWWWWRWWWWRWWAVTDTHPSVNQAFFPLSFQGERRKFSKLENQACVWWIFLSPLLRSILENLWYLVSSTSVCLMAKIKRLFSYLSKEPKNLLVGWNLTLMPRFCSDRTRWSAQMVRDPSLKLLASDQLLAFDIW